jgi:tRNA(fMet)-specific endonuclease VapC
MYLLDTNICSYVINRRYDAVIKRLRQVDPDDLYISSIVAAELAYGVENSTRVESNRKSLQEFLELIQILPWDDKAVWQYASHKTRLKKTGTTIGELDLLLGCQALAHDAIFVTNNTREFGRIEGLRLENWV